MDQSDFKEWRKKPGINQVAAEEVLGLSQRRSTEGNREFVHAIHRRGRWKCRLIRPRTAA